ncbi:MAG: transposase [Candidatus Thermoplasmatota archaeon]|nr:transposase [Candidatus Thermoplasmatota archaeon]
MRAIKPLVQHYMPGNMRYKQQMPGMWVTYTRKSGRMLHCESCDIWINRDINACISQAKRGRTRLVRSLLMEKGPPVEAVNQLKDGEQMAGSHILSTES